MMKAGTPSSAAAMSPQQELRRLHHVEQFSGLQIIVVAGAMLVRRRVARNFERRFRVAFVFARRRTSSARN
jgi:hypothetical protein